MTVSLEVRATAGTIKENEEQMNTETKSAKFIVVTLTPIWMYYTLCITLPDYFMSSIFHQS